MHTRSQLWHSDLFVCILAIALVSISFYNGYFLDSSKPISGSGWADQTLYLETAQKIAGGIPLSASDFHYQFSYPLLGSIFILAGLSDPFPYVSYGLMVTSALLVLCASRHYLTRFWSFFVIFALFFRFGDVRSLSYPSEIFMIPWNNQLAFLLFAQYFWAYSSYEEFRRPIGRRSKIIVVSIIGFTSGLAIGGREEMVLFAVPLGIYYLYLIRAERKHVVVFFLMLVAAYSPNLYFKYEYFGTLFQNVRPSDEGSGYVEKLLHYFNLHRLGMNVIDVLVNSSFRGIDAAGRPAAFEASPWLYASPVGLIFLIRRNVHMGVFVVITLGLILFYVAGENMSLEKLKFHCLRYISPAMILLSFLSVLAVERSTRAVAYFRGAEHQKGAAAGDPGGRPLAPDGERQ